LTFGAQAFFIHDERGQLLGRDTNYEAGQYGLGGGGGTLGTRTILANITTLLIKINELAEGADNVDVFTSPCDAQLGALVKAVVENFERFQDVAPVLALVVEALVEHIHDFVEIRRAEGIVSVLIAAEARYNVQTCCM
jgi:hypothetical protein